MGIESQAILAGHVAVERIVTLLRSEISGKITVRDMQRPEYKIVDFQKVDGSWTSLNLFLESWAADDYVEAFAGPSTLMTVEFSPQNYNVIRDLTAAIGGLTRRTVDEPWDALAPARS
jgi:hypothetical protein